MRFNPPQGILPHTSINTDAWSVLEYTSFNPPQGILPHTSMGGGILPFMCIAGFNPPQGILPHTSQYRPDSIGETVISFNPPQGILPHTSHYRPCRNWSKGQFQSPSGDSSSHVQASVIAMLFASLVSIPLRGFFLTRLNNAFTVWGAVLVSIPLRGFFLTRLMGCAEDSSMVWLMFQSPSGDSSSHVVQIGQRSGET